MDIYQLAVTVVLFFATLIASTFGFGLGLIAIPILASFIEVSIATPLCVMAFLTVIAVILLKQWREINFQGVWKLVVASCIGTPIGLIFLKSAQDNLLKVILGITIMFFSGWLIYQPNVIRFKTERWAWLFGVMAGFLGGAFALPAPPVLLYGIFRQWPPGSIRTNLLGFFLPSSLIVAASHWAGGFWTSSVLKLYGLSFPVILLGIVIGNYLSRIIPKEKFNKAIYGLLFLCGLLLFIRSFQVLFTL